MNPPDALGNVAGEQFRILLIRLKGIGDVTFTLPAVNAVRHNFPTAKIAYLVRKENAPLLRGFREVNETIAIDNAVWQSGNPFRIVPDLCRLLHRLRTEQFSLVIDFHGFGETAWLTRLTGAPQRWGCVFRSGSAWAYTRGIQRDWKIRPVEWNLSMLEQCGLRVGPACNDFVLPETALEEARAFFKVEKLDPAKPTLFVQPFTSSPHKDWPLENYLAVARHWRSRGRQVIFGGGPADRANLEEARAAGFALAAGRPILVSAALAKLSTLMLAGDTGLGHLAVACGTRVVMVMKSNGTGACVPFRHPEWAVVPQSEGGINVLSVAEVLAAME